MTTAVVEAIRSGAYGIGVSVPEVTMQRQPTAIIELEESGYVSLCPELDIASQGDSIEEARANLQEALELFFETASLAEIIRRISHALA